MIPVVVYVKINDCTSNIMIPLTVFQSYIKKKNLPRTCSLKRLLRRAANCEVYITQVGTWRAANTTSNGSESDAGEEGDGTAVTLTVLALIETISQRKYTLKGQIFICNMCELPFLINKPTNYWYLNFHQSKQYFSYVNLMQNANGIHFVTVSSNAFDVNEYANTSFI